MAGANQLIPAQNTFHSRSAPCTHSLVHQHQHMHQHTHQHCTFPPILHQPATAPHVPAVQHRNLNHTRGTMKPPLAPAAAFHTATQTSCRTKRGRRGALHVCIAWKIYYHKQLQKMQQKLNSLHREPTSENASAVSPPESEQQLSCKHTNTASACEQSADRNTGDGCETRITTSSPASATKREKLEQLVHLQWKEKLDDDKHRNQQSDTTKDSPPGDESWDRAATPEVGGRRGSHDRKRRLEGEGFIKGKRVKQDIVDNQFPYAKMWHSNQSAFSVTHTHPSSCAAPVQHISFSDLSVLYPDSSRFNVSSSPGGLAPYPGVAMHPCPAASWEPSWDITSRKALHSRIPVVAQRHNEHLPGFFAPSLFVPLVLRRQEAAYIRGWDASPKLSPAPPQTAVPSLWLSGTWGAESAGTL
ncbi:uncharacterized protein LOC118106713 isoform X2 [Hippoglossus stenolepis]|uniref:uncharacterized protein LOC118106713 isoform X2 n=1 Tax=Hippoglossus stenolepis TaxID=195615 RepID=UPI00159C0308|nr:uncharacterized protein LOC118106713 isoform X2 [Hippoglossus stenolepis]